MMAKYASVLLNLVMLIVGALILTLGIYGGNIESQVNHLLSTNAPTYTILLGILLILVSLWGIYAAVNEDALLMQIYLAILTMVLLGQLVLSSLVLARQADVDLLAYDGWDRAFHRDKDLLAKFEKTFSCCGFASLYDRAVPHDCTDDKEFGFIAPCHEKLSGPMKGGLKTIGTAGLVLGVVEAIGLVFAFILYADFAGGQHHYSETRRLLHEGNVPATQYTPARAT